MSYKLITLDKFNENFGHATELSSAALEGEVKSVSDDFFASANNLLLVEPAPSLKGQFGPNGALYSGWESRRHNATYDWCIIKLGTAGRIIGFDIDTSHFNGNEAPEVAVYALLGDFSESPTEDDHRWREILPVVPCGPSSRHLFKIPKTDQVNFVKLKMIPDGGIARFRVYGEVLPVFPENPNECFDLAHVFAGGRVEYISDQHFGVGSNLILPGRGKHMGDGWETKRSRVKGHKDWVIIKLGLPGYLSHVEIDTAHFIGNYPEGFEIHASNVTRPVDWNGNAADDQDWTLILPRSKLGPHREERFEFCNTAGKVFSHIRITIYPDGGIKRVRVFGRSAMGTAAQPAVSPTPPALTEGTSIFTIPVISLTQEAFAPFGEVIQAYSDHAAVPKGTRVTLANQGSATKFHKLSLLTSSYPAGSNATTGLSVYRCSPAALRDDGTLDLTILERHRFTNQAFIPMRKNGSDGQAYLVVVAQNGADDKPDMSTLKAFVADGAQGMVYKEGIWHQPMTVLRGTLDLTAVETQIGDGSSADCEIVELDKGTIWRLKLEFPA